MSVNDRVRKHRAKIHGQDRRRLEVWIHLPLIKHLRELAKFKNEPLWSAVEDALEAHLEEYRALMVEDRRLDTEHDRLVKQLHNPACKQQIEAHNRQCAAFRERLARFRQSRCHS